MNLSIRSVFIFVISVINLNVVWAVSNETDVKVPLYSHVNIESKSLNKGSEHQFLLSTPKRISNTLIIEKELTLAGDRTDLLLKIKSPGSSKKAMQFYRDFLSTKGEMLYQCEERACGSSNYWANNIFHNNKLYGRDSEQYYLAGKLVVEDKRYFVSIYAVTNGRKQQYLYLSYFPDSTPASISNPSDILNAMSKLNTWQQGVFFDSAQLDTEDLAFIKKALVEDDSLVLWLTVYTDLLESQSVSEMLKVSELQVTKFRDYLIKELKLKSNRIKQRNIGPFGDKPSGYSGATWFRLYLLR